MGLRSDRLKKLEAELEDLENWMKLGLVPKGDIEKHKEEIKAIKARVKDEKIRLKSLKDTDDDEEHVAPRRNVQRSSFAETAPMNDMHVGNGNSNNNHDESSSDIEDEAFETPANDKDKDEDDDESDAFSDRGRFRRGWTRDILDPDSNEW